MWLDEKECAKIVTETWEGVDIDSPADLMTSIIRSGEELFCWDARLFGEMPKEIAKGKFELERLQMSPQTVEAVQLARSVENRIVALSRKEELCWMREGDANTKFFHRIASGRKKRNTVVANRDSAGVCWKKEDKIKRVFVDYYTSLFTSRGNLNMRVTVDVVEHKVTKVMNEALTQTFTEDEVAKALFQMHPTKALGLDGMSAIFYKKLWG